MTWNAQKWLALFFVAGVLSGQTVLAQTNVFTGGYGNSRTNANLGDSEACRSAFRSDVDHDSEMKSISIPI